MFFDRNEDVEFHFKGRLPHMHQDGTMQSVTFRLADSLPHSVCKELKERKEAFLREFPKPWDKEIKIKYWKLIGPLEHRLMDNGYGSCLLKFKENRQLLIETIAFKDEIDYIVDSYVIMPNHVHILVLPLGNTKIEDIIYSIKRNSAIKINRKNGRRGQFWMKEYFDRMVRSEEDYERCRRYIIDNPQFLPPGTFTIYVRES